MEKAKVHFYLGVTYAGKTIKLLITTAAVYYA